MNFPFLAKEKRRAKLQLFTDSKSPRRLSTATKSSFIRLSISQFSELNDQIKSPQLQNYKPKRSITIFASPANNRTKSPKLFKSKRPQLSSYFLPKFFESANKENGEKTSSSSTSQINKSAVFTKMKNAATLSRLRTSINQSTNEFLPVTCSNLNLEEPKMIPDLDLNHRGNFNDLPTKKKVFLTSYSGSYKCPGSISSFVMPSMNGNFSRKNMTPGSKDTQKYRKKSIYRTNLKDMSSEEIKVKILSPEEMPLVVVEEAGTFEGFDGSFTSCQNFDEQRRQELAKSHSRQQARKKDLKELISVSRISKQYEKSTLNIPITIRRASSRLISEFITEEVSSTKLARLHQPVFSGSETKTYLIDPTERSFVSCPLIFMKQFPNPLCEQFEVSSVLQHLYNSYWIECVDKLLESRSIFDEEAGYNIILKTKMGIEEFRPLNMMSKEGPQLKAYLDFLSKIVIDLDYSHIA